MPILTLDSLAQKYRNTITRPPPRNMGWSLFGSSSDADVGNQVLQSYFDQAVQYSGFGFTDYQTWIDSLNAIISDYPSFVGSLVNSNSASTTVGQAADRVAALADSTSGQAKIQDITGYAGGQGSDYSVNLMAAIPAVASATAGQIASTTGNALVGIGNLSLTVMKYLPYILGAGAVVYFLPQIMAAKKALTKSNPRIRYLKTGRTRHGQFQRKVISRQRYRSGRAAPKRHSTVNQRIREELRVIKEGIPEIKRLRKILAGQVRSGEYRKQDAERVMRKFRKELSRQAKIAGLKKFPR